MNILGKKEKITLFIIGLLVFSNILVWRELFSLINRNLEVVFFDVGQGDSIFIETPQGHQIMIDGGPDATVVRKLKEEIPFWDRSIDLVILTHPEKDHLAGLIEVLKRYRIDHILWTGIVRKTNSYNEWEKLIKEEKAKVTIVRGGEKIKAGGVKIDILYPLESLEGKELESSNETSIVSRLIFKNNSFLFTGDVSKTTEEKLLQEYLTLASNVLKVAHHGSKFSSGEEFLQNVFPQIAVIQTGENSYGHPTEEVLERMRSVTDTILRTDIDGDIKLISNGKNLIIKS